MLDHLLNFLTSDLEVISGVERCGVVGKNAADACGHSKTDIGVDIDLTNSHLSCATKLLLGNAYCIGELTAESVDLCNVFLGNRGCAVENDRELGKSLADLFENVEAERRRNEDALLVSCALCGSDTITPAVLRTTPEAVTGSDTG